MKKKKLGRNASCYCGSGEKYKHCCLNKNVAENVSVRWSPEETNLDDTKEKHKQQRLAAIGYKLGHHQVIRKGKRFRSLFSRLVERPVNETFQEFTLDILLQVLGRDWLAEQALLTFDKKHFVTQTLEKYVDWKKANANEEEKKLTGTYSGLPDGFSQYLFDVAFDLYCVIHSGNKLPEELLARLRQSTEEFQGARYEILVAAIFARLGFKLKFFDNTDRTLGEKHPEFIAALPNTDIEIAVEAKSKRKRGVLHTKGEKETDNLLTSNIRSLLSDALKKETKNKPYIIFVDVNVNSTDNASAKNLDWVKDIIDKSSAEFKKDTEHTKENLVVVTNFSPHYQEDSLAKSYSYLLIDSLSPKYVIPEQVKADLLTAVENYAKIRDLDRYLGEVG